METELFSRLLENLEYLQGSPNHPLGLMQVACLGPVMSGTLIQHVLYEGKACYAAPGSCIDMTVPKRMAAKPPRAGQVQPVHRLFWAEERWEG